MISRLKILKPFFFLLLLSTSAYSQFKEGHYYTKDGKRIDGLLEFRFGGNLFTNKSDGDCSLAFKADKKSKKQRFTTNDICCFVIEKDSFAIIRNFQLNGFVSYPQDFAKVIERGKINLYIYYSRVASKYGAYDVEDWVIEKDGKTDKLTNRKFKKLMPVYLSDYPDLAAKVTGKSLKYDDAPAIIKMYNSYFRNR